MVVAASRPETQAPADGQRPSQRLPDWRRLGRALIERAVVADHQPDLLSQAEDILAEAEAEFDVALQGDGPLTSMAAATDLDADDVRVLAVCAAVEFDRDLQRVVDDMTGRPDSGRLDVALLTRLLGVKVVAELADDSRLARAGLLEVQAGVPFASAQLSVPRRVVWALLNDDSLDPDLARQAEIISVPTQLVGTETFVCVHGPDRIRRIQAAVTVCAGLSFLVAPPPADDRGWRTLVLQAGVGGYGVVLELNEPPSATARY